MLDVWFRVGYVGNLGGMGLGLGILGILGGRAGYFGHFEFRAENLGRFGYSAFWVVEGSLGLLCK